MKIDARVTPIDTAPDRKLKALASITVNNEVAISGIRIFDGEKGLFVQMPQTKTADGDYKDIVFPITAETRTEIQNAVLERYKNPISIHEIQLIGAYETTNHILSEDRITAYDDNTKSYIEKPDITMENFRESLIATHDYMAKQNPEINAEKTKLSVSLKTANGEFTKATGQIVLDNTIVITGVKIVEGSKGPFVKMPSYQDQYGEYKDFAFPITAEMHERLQNAALTAYQNIGKYEYKGVKFAELGEKDDIKQYAKLNNKFAEKLMSELDNRNIPYFAKIADTTEISFNKANTAEVEQTQKELKETLKPVEQRKAR